jgi:lysozyme
MMKRLSQQGAALVHEFEGLRLTAYQDEAGVWTIGWGHTGPDARPGARITRARAEELFDADNDAAEAAVHRLERLRTESLSQEQFDALVSFEFNTGALSNKNNRVTQHVINGRDDLVDDEMLRWVHITDPGTKKKRVSNGLKRRRMAEAALWVKGCTPVMFNSPEELEAVVGATPQPITPATPTVQATSSPAVQGSAVATASTVLATAAEQIEPLAPYSDTLRIVFVILALAGVALAVWGATRPRAVA